MADVDLEVDARCELVAAVDLEVDARLQTEQGDHHSFSRLMPAKAGCDRPLTGCGRLQPAGCDQVGACCELVADVDLKVDARYELVAVVDLEVDSRCELVAAVDFEVDARYELVAAIDLEVDARLRTEQGIIAASAGSS